MTTLANSEGRIINYTNGFIETMLLQLNSSNNYYTAGGDDVIFIKKEVKEQYISIVELIYEVYN